MSEGHLQSSCFVIRLRATPSSIAQLAHDDTPYTYLMQFFFCSNIKTDLNSTYTIFVIAIVLWYMHNGRGTSESPNINALLPPDGLVQFFFLSISLIAIFFFCITSCIVNSLHTNDAHNRICLLPSTTTESNKKKKEKNQSIFNDRTNKTGTEPKIAKNFASSRSTCCFWLALNYFCCL